MPKGSTYPLATPTDDTDDAALGVKDTGGGVLATSRYRWSAVADYSNQTRALTVTGHGSATVEDHIQAALDGLAGRQPLDSDLTAIAALSTQTFGRSLLTQANAGAARTTLGLGTAAQNATGDFDPAGAAAAAQAASQPLDSDLTAIAALATQAFGRGTNTWANAAAGRTGLGLGTAAQNNTGDFEVAGAAAAAQAASQPLDSDLTSIAGLTTTSFGRSLLTQADASATRTTLGLGTAATQPSSAFDAAGAAAAAQAASQPLDADLTAVAALATQTFGRSLLTQASASAARTTLGLGTASTMTAPTTGSTVMNDSRFASLQADFDVADSTTIDIVTLGDSIMELSGWGKTLETQLAQRFNGRQGVVTQPILKAGIFHAGASNTPMTGTGTPTEAVAGGWGMDLTNGQTRQFTTTCDGVIVCWSTVGGGSIQVKDGASVVATINTALGSGSSNFTSVDFGSTASRTVTFQSVGNTRLALAYATLGNRTAGVRVWQLAKSGETTGYFLNTIIPSAPAADVAHCQDFIAALKAFTSKDPTIIVNTGANDSVVADYTTNLTALIPQLQAVTNGQVVTAQQWMASTHGNTMAWARAGRAVVASAGTPLIDFSRAFGDVSLNSNANGDSADGLHSYSRNGYTQAAADLTMALLTGDAIEIGITAVQRGRRRFDGGTVTTPGSYFGVRRDTAANWAAANSLDMLVNIGEFAYETDTGKLKLSPTALTNYTALTYFPDTLDMTHVAKITQPTQAAIGIILNNTDTGTNSGGSAIQFQQSGVAEINLQGGNLLGTSTVPSFVIADVPNARAITTIFGGGGTSSFTYADNVVFAYGTTTGSKHGTATSQKQAWWNATPIVQPANNTDLKVVLTSTGLLASGGTTPLNIGTGALTAGATTLGTLGASTTTLTGNLVMNAVNIQTDTVTGMMICTGGSQKIGYFGTTPIGRPSAYTQTYTTASKTFANLTGAALTVSVGTPSTTIPDVGAAFSQTTMNNIIRSLADMINLNRTDAVNTKNNVGALLDDFQAYGQLV